MTKPVAMDEKIRGNPKFRSVRLIFLISNNQCSMSNEQVRKRTNNAIVKTTRYFPTFETENGKLEHLFTPEGAQPLAD